jgi:hypothetical protein
MLQRRTLNNNDITIGSSKGFICIDYEGDHPGYSFDFHNRIEFNLAVSRASYVSIRNASNNEFRQVAESEPGNLIYPYLSKRKTLAYTDQINETNANSVNGNLVNLFSKVDRLVTPQFQPGNKLYVKACREILGYEISTLAKGGGKQAVYFVHNLEHIPLTSMGEGVSNILGLVTDLCIAENRIFLIEEPENDIHPKALKALLKIIVEKSNTNQFFVSTHSNIVMKYLGAANGSKVFNVTNDKRDEERENLFLSEVKEVSDNPEERRLVLEDLGYDFFDFDLWKSWLFLEESSAEVIIRDYLIPWFVKGLSNKIKTFSAGGISNIATKFEDFDRLFVFLHLEPVYKNKVWIKIDGGEEEKRIIDNFISKYSNSGWSASNFSQFKEHDFEKYYPDVFQSRVKGVLGIRDKKEKREKKRELLNEVKAWIKDNEDVAKNQFKESAKEVIDFLKLIERKVNN